MEFLSPYDGQCKILRAEWLQSFVTAVVSTQGKHKGQAFPGNFPTNLGFVLEVHSSLTVFYCDCSHYKQSLRLHQDFVALQIQVDRFNIFRISAVLIWSRLPGVIRSEIWRKRTSRWHEQQRLRVKVLIRDAGNLIKQVGAGLTKCVTGGVASVGGTFR